MSITVNICNASMTRANFERFCSVGLLFLAASCFTVPRCFGQSGKAELLGTILDPATLPIANAKIRLEEQATHVTFETASGEHGEYHFLGLPVGEYVLTVEHPGFRIYRRSAITMRIADQVSLDVQLAIGQPAQTIDVSEQASLLQTT